MEKTDKELLEIWEENTKQTVKGINDFESLTTQEKSKLFDLIQNA